MDEIEDQKETELIDVNDSQNRNIEQDNNENNVQKLKMKSINIAFIYIILILLFNNNLNKYINIFANPLLDFLIIIYPIEIIWILVINKIHFPEINIFKIHKKMTKPEFLKIISYHVTFISIFLIILFFLFLMILIIKYHGNIEKLQKDLEAMEIINKKIQDQFNDIIFILLMCIVGPVSEEIIFRGLLSNVLNKYGKLFSIIFTGISFGISHSIFFQSLSAIFAGMIFTFLNLEYSIFWPIFLHIANNSILSFLGFIAPIFPIIIIIIIILIIFCFDRVCREEKGIKYYFRKNKDKNNYKIIVYCIPFYFYVAYRFYDMYVTQNAINKTLNQYFYTFLSFLKSIFL